MKKRCVLVGASSINNYDRICSYIRENDYFIFCDGGLFHRKSLGVSPNLIVGDFDSHELENFKEETIVLPRMKDDTDSFYAAKVAIARGYKDILLVGMSGNRLDHTLANISLMLMLIKNNSKAMLLDDFSETELVSEGSALISDKFPYFSLMTVDGKATVSIENALYPLDCFTIEPDFPIGISNEPLPGKTAKVQVLSGKILLFRIFDR